MADTNSTLTAVDSITSSTHTHVTRDPADAMQTTSSGYSPGAEGQYHQPHHGLGQGSQQKAVIKNVDMSDDMQRVSVEIALSALEKYTVEKDIAAEVKKEFDRKFGPTWHAVVGKNFGSYVTHGKHPSPFDKTGWLNLRAIETKHFIYFYVSNIAFLIWKS
jgi:dynein light chain LC8-type